MCRRTSLHQEVVPIGKKHKVVSQQHWEALSMTVCKQNRLMFLLLNKNKNSEANQWSHRILMHMNPVVLHTNRY